MLPWSYSRSISHFGTDGCSVAGCAFHGICATVNCCALNLSDALIQAGYTLPHISESVNYCPHGRVRGAADMVTVNESPSLHRVVG